MTEKTTGSKVEVHLDCETDGLLDVLTKVHVMSVSVDGNPVERLVGHTDIEAFLRALDPERHVLVAHNGIGFDIPALAKVFKWRWTGEVIDTLRLSCLFEPDIFGGHSLEEWGKRLGFNKLDYKGECKRLGIADPWAEYNPLMGDYCDIDVEVLIRLHAHLKAVEKASPIDWTLSKKIEHEFAKWFTLMGIRGVNVDRESTQALFDSIESEMIELQERVEPLLPEKPLNVGEKNDVTPPKRQINKAGKPTSYAQGWFDNLRELPAGGWEGMKFGKWVTLPHHEPMVDKLPMTLSDQLHIKYWLMDQGWRPTIWSFKKVADKNGKLRVERDATGKPIKNHPKFHEKGELCEGLASINAEFPAVADVVRWVVLRHRKGLVKSILEHIRPDGRVTADGMPHGTPTGRVAHMVVCNIPKAEPEVVLGHECRAMFTARAPNVMAGVDASGLELRMLAHYVGDPDFNQTILNGRKESDEDYAGVDEIHTLLMKATGGLVPSRSIMKNVTYAWLYGAGDEKIGLTAGYNEGKAEDMGAKIRARMITSVPGLERLMAGCEDAARRKHIRAIDGRKIDVRSSHAVLNTLLQSAGSICVKVATNYMMEQIIARKLRAVMVIHMHK